MENLTGSAIKGYELQERLGAGSFGAVYRAYQTSIRREVAVKIILPHYATQPEFIRRFEMEAQIVARLEHPHIIPLYDFWRDSEGACLVMRYVKGKDLRAALQDGPFDVQRTALLLDQVAAALSLAHRRHVVHRDLKPSNILLDEDGNTYVTDFGIAKDLSQPLFGTSLHEEIDTPEYFSPEEARHEPTTPQTDIYSLGVLLYEVLTSQHPFSDVSAVERMYKHLNDPLPQIVNLSPSICTAVNGVIQKATAKNPNYRYVDVLALAVAFREAVGLRLNQTTENVVEILTPREQEVLQCLADGDTNAEIAQKLVLEISTVKWYVKQLFAKLHVTNRVQAGVRARSLNLITSQSNGSSAQPIEVSAHPLALKNPYKGLLAFQTADQDDFFGREAFTDKLIKRLGEGTELTRFLSVIGPSGSGKSSLIKAGLFPQLLRGALPGSDRWFMAEMVPGEHPLRELAITLARLASVRADDLSEQLQRDERSLVRVAQFLLPNDGSQLVLVVDQLEEVFTLIQSERERSHFLNLIYEAVTNVRSRLYIIVALRADFYDRPLLYPDFGELVRSRMETVLPLTADGLERAIIEPAARAGLTFEPGLVPSIISDVNYQPGALPLLQYALAELFDRRQGSLLTRSAYLEMGGAVGALAQRADETYDSLDADGQAAAQQMFLRLVNLGDEMEATRRRAFRADLLTLTADSSTMDDVIDAFAGVRLLSLDHDPATRRPTVELAHEAILREWKQLCGWLDESRHDIRMARLLAAATDEWLQAERDHAFLLRGSRLDQFQSWSNQTQLMLSPKERDYLDASLAEREQQIRTDREREAHALALAQEAANAAQQAAEAARSAAAAQRQAANRLRALTIVLFTFFLVALGLSLLAFSSRNEALFQARVAFSRQLAVQAVNELQKPLGNDEFAALLAVRSLKLGYDPIADAALTEAMDRLPLKAFRGHRDEIYSVTFSPDGNYALTASADHTTRLWHIGSGQELRIFAHSGEVYSAVFSPDGKYVLSGSEDMTVRLWDVTTGQQIRAFSGHRDAVWSVAFSPDGKYVLSGSEDMTVRLWDVTTGQQIRVFTMGAIRSVAFSPDGKSILAGGDPHEARLWDAATGQLMQVFSGHSEMVYGVAFSPDGKFVLTGSTDNTARLWDTVTGQSVRSFNGHSSSVRSVAFSPDGKSILTGSGDYTAILWDVATGQQMRALRGHTDKIWSAAFSPDGKSILTGSIDRIAKLWDISGRSRRVFGGHTDEVHGVASSPDGKYIVTTSADGLAILWDVATGQQRHAFNEGRDIIWSAAFSPNGNYVLTGGRLRTATLWDTTTGQSPVTLRGHTADVHSVAFSPDGRFVLTGSIDGTARLWETATGLPVHTFSHRTEVKSVAFSPNGKYVLTGSTDNTAQMWDTVTGQQVRTFRFSGEGDAVWGVAFSPDGKYVLTGSTARTAILWDTATGQPLRTFRGHKNAIYSVAFSPDGKYILTGSADRLAILWDTTTGQQLRTLSGHRSAVWSVAFLPDGKHLLTGSFDGTARLWETDYADFLTTVCARLLRDFTELEREHVHLADEEPTCS
jgi:WD40 repeat protein/serine/threonine protein kinase